ITSMYPLRLLDENGDGAYDALLTDLADAAYLADLAFTAGVHVRVLQWCERALLAARAAQAGALTGVLPSNEVLALAKRAYEAWTLLPPPHVVSPPDPRVRARLYEVHARVLSTQRRHTMTQGEVLDAFAEVCRGWRRMAVTEAALASMALLAPQHAWLAYHDFPDRAWLDRAAVLGERGLRATTAFAAAGEAFFADWQRELRWRAIFVPARAAHPLAADAVDAFAHWLQRRLSVETAERVARALGRDLLAEMAGPGCAATAVAATSAAGDGALAVAHPAFAAAVLEAAR